jgi:hypothetical protein
LVIRACSLKSDRETPTLDFLLRGLSFKRRRAFLNTIPHESKPNHFRRSDADMFHHFIGRAKALVAPEAQYFPNLITTDH